MGKKYTIAGRGRTGVLGVTLKIGTGCCSMQSVRDSFKYELSYIPGKYETKY